MSTWVQMGNKTSITAAPEPAFQPVPSRLRVLVVDEEAPFPPNTGKRIRTWNLLKRVASRHDITLLCYGGEQGRELDPIRQAGITLRLVQPLPELTGPELYVRLLGNVFSPYPYSVKKHYTPRFQKAVDELLSTDGFDLLHCEWTPYVRYSTARMKVASVLATHNIESQIWERRAEHASSALARIFFKMQARKMAAFERRHFPRMSAVTAVSPEDARQSTAWSGRECALVENGVDLDQFQPAGSGQPSELLFLGSLDWFPNRDAVQYMIEEILPVIRSAQPDVILRIVGRRPPADFIRKFEEVEGVRILGEVEDVRPHLERAGIVVVPLRIGGGSRIKILESLAMGKAVISTRVGAEGLAVEHGRDICLADTPKEFAQCVQQLSSDGERVRLGRNGRTLVEQRYSWDDCANALETAWYRAYKFHRGEAHG